MKKSAEYSGVDNLEVMQCAVNYNRYLQQLVLPRLTRQGLNVDFGAGVGTFSRPFLQLDFPLCCVEADADLCRRLEENGLRAVQDLSQISAETIANIYSLNVLEHIQNDEDAIAQIYNALAVGGTLLIYVPAFQLLYSSMDKKVGHWRRYRLKELEEKVQSAGFVIEKSAYADCLGFIASLLYKYLGSPKGDINEQSLIIYDRIVFPLSSMLDRVFGKWFGKNVYIMARKI